MNTLSQQVVNPYHHSMSCPMVRLIKNPYPTVNTVNQVLISPPNTINTQYQQVVHPFHNPCTNTMVPFIKNPCYPCNTTVNTINPVPPILTNKNLQSFYCHICDKKLKNIKTLNHHVKTQHLVDRTKIYTCPLCPYKTNVKGSLKKHYDLQHENKFIRPFHCQVADCKFTTKQKSHLTEHMAYKHKIGKNLKQYKCSLCPYTTYHLGSMKRHVKNVVHHKKQK
jgi:hypothetical protein